MVIPAGEPRGRLYNALGDTVNVAARLQSLGDLVVGPETARQVDASFELEPLGELELKGKAESVAAFLVTANARRRRDGDRRRSSVETTSSRCSSGSSPS